VPNFSTAGGYGTKADGRTPASSCAPAFELFTAMGIKTFAGRAERELVATGEHVHKREVETRDELTAQEAQVAGLARDGLSNRDIGDRLFISQHTVAYHLRAVNLLLSGCDRTAQGSCRSRCTLLRAKSRGASTNELDTRAKWAIGCNQMARSDPSDHLQQLVRWVFSNA
jgi:DNA-binding CsgD family transcriptional regulator